MKYFYVLLLYGNVARQIEDMLIFNKASSINLFRVNSGLLKVY